MPRFRSRSRAQIDLDGFVKLLLDHNLSFRIARLLLDIYPGSVDVRDLGMASVSDQEIWAYAASERFTIVTKDSDFLQRSLLRGAPPKVIWIACGNCSTKRIIAVLMSNEETIRLFEENKTAAFLILP